MWCYIPMRDGELMALVQFQMNSLLLSSCWSFKIYRLLVQNILFLRVVWVWLRADLIEFFIGGRGSEWFKGVIQ